ncbi:hypothetical protein PsorP6_017582 [Peronosclerospora sorghi]|uniref:Uncharacterized protein n=1 Tax=Peronosclerospora sorghi TaxID=230839 RepID=A0ACC0WLV5_9STRA|nr:hypothetical protein PsorP6_017582 [Peronosclerospora sorghi]
MELEALSCNEQLDAARLHALIEETNAQLRRYQRKKNEDLQKRESWPDSRLFSRRRNSSHRSRDSFHRTRRSETDLEQAKDEILRLFVKYTEKENDSKNLEETRNQLER